MGVILEIVRKTLQIGCHTAGLELAPRFCFSLSWSKTAIILVPTVDSKGKPIHSPNQSHHGNHPMFWFDAKIFSSADINTNADIMVKK